MDYEKDNNIIERNEDIQEEVLKNTYEAEDKHDTENANNFESVYETKSHYQNENTKVKSEDSVSRLPRVFFAGFFIRMIAYLIDSFAIWGLSRITINPLMNALSIWHMSEFLTILATLLYFSIFTYLSNGYTLGKMICSIRLVEEDRERLSLSTVIVREIFGRFIMEKIPFLYLMVIFTSNRQHLADMLTDTYVISEKSFEAARYENIEIGGNRCEV
ncbi:MAG: RDD family protein [Tissierellia bacterium]|nr:RDD family protein [Tissierellia bacterium]